MLSVKAGVLGRRRAGGLALGCLMSALAACGGLADDDAAAVVGRVKEGMEAPAAGVQVMSTQAAAAAATQTSGAAPVAVKGASGLMPDQVGRAARAEVARALGVPSEQVSLEKVEAVQWNDASLGCAEAGKSYAPVAGPGFRILLTAGGQQRQVHADADGRMVVCQNPTQ